MKIALDYDGTYTRDPDLWSEFIELAQDRGHEVAIVTKRYPAESLGLDLHIPIFYTSRNPKLKNHFNPDIWIDNNPFDITGYP